MNAFTKKDTSTYYSTVFDPRFIFGKVKLALEFSFNIGKEGMNEWMEGGR